MGASAINWQRTGWFLVTGPPPPGLPAGEEPDGGAVARIALRLVRRLKLKDVTGACHGEGTLARRNDLSESDWSWYVE